jgi:hypothetical protein
MWCMLLQLESPMLLISIQHGCAEIPGEDVFLFPSDGASDGTTRNSNSNSPAVMQEYTAER